MRVPRNEVADVDFAFSEGQFTEAFHDSSVPRACVCFLEVVCLEGPDLFAVTVGLRLLHVTGVGGPVRIGKLARAV